ncbi:hypothetical protein HRbin04_00158 [archaeon HR04]|nr:hypothetical protein HRbin04_00158 [archaeon HR04]
MSSEFRFCDRCMRRTKHDIVVEPEMATYKRRRLYRCSICGKESWKRGLRPSSEISY